MRNDHSTCNRLISYRTFWQRIAVWTALLSLVALPTQADDTEVYINPSTTPVTPNIMMILDLSGSMGWAPDGSGNPPAGGSRLDILKQSINSLLTNTELPEINIGLTTFAGSSAHGVQWPALGINDDATSYVAAIPSEGTGKPTVGDIVNRMVQASDDGGSTPSVDALYEVARYFRGEAENSGGVGGFGTWNTTTNTFTGAYDDSPNPISYSLNGPNAIYNSPITDQCQNSAILFLTDGEPTRNTVDRGLATGQDLVRRMIATETGVGVGNLSCEDQSVAFGAAPGGSTSANCAIELVDFLNNYDQIPSVVGSTVTTNTIGFGLVGTSGARNWAYLQRVAAAGGGQAYLADDVTTLTASFNNVIDSLITGNQSFRNFSATFDVNTLSTGDRAYLSMFKPALKRAWTGNLKGYYLRPDGLYDITDVKATELDTDNQVSFKPTARSFWSTVVDGNTPQAGGIVGNLLAGARNIYVVTDPTEVANVDLNDGAHNLKSTNTNLTTTLMGMPAGSTAAERAALIASARSEKMGDPLHTRSEIVSYGGSTGNVLYIATNQGFLHAIDINRPNAVGDVGGGNEIFAFMPNELIGNLHAQSQNSNTGGHIYGIDGPFTVWRQDLNSDGIINNSDKVFLYFGMRRGGSAYYAMDVTDPTDPKLMWKIDKSSTGFSKMGQSWSKMTLADIKQGNTTRKALVFAGGYDTDQDDIGVARSATGDDEGLGIYIVSAETGALYKSIGPDDNDGINNNNFGIRTSSFDDMKYSIPADVKLVDTNNNGIEDRIYFADMGGQVWRIDIAETGGWNSTGKFTGYKLADIGVDATGSATPASNRRFFYAPSVARFTHNSKFVFAISLGSGYRAHPLDNTISDKVVTLYDVDTATGVPGTTPDTVANPSTIDLSDLYNATSDILTNGTEAERTQAEQDLNAAKGWFISLEANEKVLSRTRLFRNRVLMTTFQPQASVNACDVGGTTNRLYVLSLGSAAGAFPIDSDNDGSLDTNVRSQEVADQALILDEPLVVTYHDPGNPNPQPGEDPEPPKTCAGVYGGAQQMLSICSSPVKVNWTTLQ